MTRNLPGPSSMGSIQFFNNLNIFNTPVQSGSLLMNKRYRLYKALFPDESFRCGRCFVKDEIFRGLVLKFVAHKKQMKS